MAETRAVHMMGYALITAALNLFFFGCVTHQKFSESASFDARCHAPGVIRCIGFDSQTETDQYISPPWGQTQKRGVVVTDAKASGTGSLRFEVPTNTGADTSGNFSLNFADDLSVQLGEGDEFYVQWRQRFSPEFLDTYYEDGLGWKQIVIGEGDRPGFYAPGCTQLEIVVANMSQFGSPQMYHSCGGKDGQYEPLYQSRTMRYVPNDWITYLVHVKIGTWYKNDGNYHGDSTVQLWVARSSQPSELVVDLSPEPATLFGIKIPGTASGYDLANTNQGSKYGKVMLTPYHTSKSPSQGHPTGYVWYDELIISRAKIRDPQ